MLNVPAGVLERPTDDGVLAVGTLRRRRHQPHPGEQRLPA